MGYTLLLLIIIDVSPHLPSKVIFNSVNTNEHLHFRRYKKECEKFFLTNISECSLYSHETAIRHFQTLRMKAFDSRHE